MIVGGGGVRLIPCDLDCINGVDSSLHFFFLESFVLILEFFSVVLGVGGGWWWRVVPMVVGGAGGLCLCMVVGLGSFFFFGLWILCDYG